MQGIGHVEDICLHNFGRRLRHQYGISRLVTQTSLSGVWNRNRPMGGRCIRRLGTTTRRTAHSFDPNTSPTSADASPSPAQDPTAHGHKLAEHRNWSPKQRRLHEHKYPFKNAPSRSVLY